MHASGQPSPPPPEPPTAPRFRCGRLLLWLPVCLILGTVVAWAATLVERFSAPVVIFSLMVGAVLGATLIGMVRVLQVGNRPTVLLGAVVAAAVAVVGQHYISYRTAYQAAQDERAYRLAQLAFQGEELAEVPVPPDGFYRFLRWRAARGFGLLGFKAQGWRVWVLWATDGVLVLGAALAVVGPALRRPYCDRCRSWFRAIRRGPVDPPTARQLARLVEAELAEPPALASYRLLACHGGCAPTLFRLCWVKPKGGVSSLNVWLDPERRSRIVDALDQRSRTT